MANVQRNIILCFFFKISCGQTAKYYREVTNTCDHYAQKVTDTRNMHKVSILNDEYIKKRSMNINSIFNILSQV